MWSEPKPNCQVLIDQLRASTKAETYHHKVESFFASSPAAQLATTLPGGKSGTLVAAIGPNWAMLRVAGNRPAISS